MKIAVTYPDVRLTGGVERVVVDAANHLARLGHDVHVHAARVAPGVLDGGVRVHAIPARPRPEALNALSYRRRAEQSIAAHPADVHAAFSALSPPGGVFWVPSVHRSAYELVLDQRTGLERIKQQSNPYHRVRLELERRAFAPGGYDHVLVIGPGVRDDILRHYDMSPADIGLQPLGYDHGRFDAAQRPVRRAATRLALGLDDDDRVVGFVANELERKGFSTLVRAVAGLQDRRVRIRVVGRVDPKEAAAVLTEHELTARTTFTGAAEDVSAEYAAADVFALPTRYEPWGLVIVEALASGLPVCTTRLAGAATAVADGDTGRLLDDPEDAATLTGHLRWALDGGAASAEEIGASVAWLRWESVVRDYAETLERFAH